MGEPWRFERANPLFCSVFLALLRPGTDAIQDGVDLLSGHDWVILRYKRGEVGDFGARD